MGKRIGSYVTVKVPGESYKAYIPSKLPFSPVINMESLATLLERAVQAIAEANQISNSIPNVSLFVYTYVRKEALLSSQIEGTQSSFSDLILFENKQKPSVSIDDVEEVSLYVKAINHAVKRLNGGFPLSLRLLKETHEILLSGGRGKHKLPGEFRRSQNWIGGTRPGNALFVPPPVDYLDDCLSNLEKFLHYTKMPILIKAGIAHVQFETIHPFLDGNGRLGRLLIILLFIEGDLLDAPILYLSLYFKKHRETYYNLLEEVRIHGTWETWVEFFLQGVIETSKDVTKTIKKINTIFEHDAKEIQKVGRARFSCERVLEFLKKLPQASVNVVAESLDMSLPTARAVLALMVKHKIVKEISGKQRGKVYVYKKYLDILEEGTKPIR
jgi:Fic family protein